ncbi:MAG: N-acetyl-1-D-myo-inosityl-2-amino-2-deoxy-alpha-D-glucopyranoside deacetylase MshB [uncultured Truepera sp.]|uniref:N-acetyl-1-D-myo-inosityl-2-amino-2-deoxy-alpha-D -glucopyranoside deacetylase MshB n=1 Tax=uncultured Truepera sp. TaxID=543023 RepID=A0A6J4VMH4_9DEIN|nr:MAG: N-acetyl-1-D-myo-inosityl-2-amino-2-deoxy-alpha-D-glucopyranoside deacetylase MshB [uncultured Truepera sp.]
MNASLLAVFAHPDDEVFSGGTLAHYAGLGANVTLVCATKGDAGKVTDPELRVNGAAELAELRETELRRSAELLGVTDLVLLGYGDSGREERLRTGDAQALMNTDPLVVEAKLRDVIAQTRPQVIVTFDPHGGYGHADHLVVHRATSAAFFSTGHLDGAPQRLFFGVTPTETARAFGEERGIDPLLYGVSDDTVALKLDVKAHMEKKLAALAAHRSQMGPTSRMAQLTTEARAKMDGFFETEAFALGGTRGPLSLPLRGLFDGLGLPVI